MATDALISDPLIWIATGGLIAWFTAFISLRKDDRAVVIDNVTKERKDWRIYLRQWCADVSKLSTTVEWDDHSYLKYRADLVTRLNFLDDFDKNLILFFDENFKTNDRIDSEKVIKLQLKISQLLKNDWEKVKIDCNPFYKNFFELKSINRRKAVENKIFLKDSNHTIDQSKSMELKDYSAFRAIFYVGYFVAVLLLGISYINREFSVDLVVWAALSIPIVILFIEFFLYCVKKH
ncbi:hypothetical protein [uncultured Acinetobacter sp.]|uniref:hypothetical protein n=1 Tax=uncultured Acinetobacter sp. TaxID=165433 RepID=UPI00258452DF|nr:hypothetical protein [uncultured Acinetobacter sp.]